MIEVQVGLLHGRGRHRPLRGRLRAVTHRPGGAIETEDRRPLWDGAGGADGAPRTDVDGPHDESRDRTVGRAARAVGGRGGGVSRRRRPAAVERPRRRGLLPRRQPRRGRRRRRSGRPLRRDGRLGGAEPPTPFFDTAFYLVANPDVAAAGLNPLHHYLAGGAEEGRAAGPGFDTAYYIAQNPEVGLSGMNPLLHYLLHGRHEGPDRDALRRGRRLRGRRAGAAGGRGRGRPRVCSRAPRADAVHFPPGGPPRRARRRARCRCRPLRLAQRIGSVTPRGFRRERARHPRRDRPRAAGRLELGGQALPQLRLRCRPRAAPLRPPRGRGRRVLGLRHRRELDPLVGAEPVAPVPLLPDRRGADDALRGRVLRHSSARSRC